MDQSIIIELLGDRPIAYHPILAKALGSVKAAVFLSQLLYWHGKGRWGAWTYKTAEDFFEETGLSRKEQETARRLLKRRGVLEERLAGVPATLHFRVMLDELCDVLSRHSQSSFPQSAKLDSPKVPNWIPPKCQTISETTPESTSKISPSTKNSLPVQAEDRIDISVTEKRNTGVKADKPKRDLWDLSRETEQAREEIGNWAVPPDAGGDSEWNDGPVDAFAVLAGLSSDILPDRKRRAWGKRLAAIAGEWSSEDHVVGPGDMVAAIKAIPDSDVGWKSYTDPSQKNFAADVGPLLFAQPNGGGKTWVVG